MDDVSMPESVTPEQWRKLVGIHVQRRREQLGLSSRYLAVDGLDISETWWRQIETGEVRRNDGEVRSPNPRGNNLRQLTDRLNWPSDAIDRLLAGDDPATLEGVARLEQFLAKDDDGTTIDLNSRVARLPDHVRDVIIGIVETEERKQQP